MRRLFGWTPRTRSWTDAEGVTWSQPEPELDWADSVLLLAWMALRDDLCGLCGRPLALHEESDPATFHTGYRTCPAIQALDVAQTARRASREDEQARSDGLDPERARTWLTWTDEEGPPRY